MVGRPTSVSAKCWVVSRARQPPAYVVSERTYDVAGFISAYLAFLTWGHLENELGEYHRSRYGALRAAFGVDVQLALADGASSDNVHLWDLFHDVLRGHAAASTPFDGMLETPPFIGKQVLAHARRLTELRDATRRELVSLAATIFTTLYTSGNRSVSERELVEHGFIGGVEPDPWDFW